MQSNNPAPSKSGYLKTPENIQPLYVEPAIKWKVKQKSYFYEKAPLKKKNQYVEDQSAEEYEVTSAYKVILLTRKLKESPASENFVALGELEPNTEVLVRPFEYRNEENKVVKHPFLQQVATFEKVGKRDTTMPESGNEIKVKAIGYMYNDDLSLIEDGEEFKRSEKELFPHRPCKEDIIQAGMGDCFFLSSLNAILAKGEEGIKFIEEMMVDQGDGTVIVRLFDPRDGKPVYVRVEKSEHFKNGVSAVKHGALWVHILEKAYAGFAFKSNSSKEPNQSFADDPYVVSQSSFLSMYGSGGQEELALRVLTGKKSKQFSIANKSKIMNPIGLDSQGYLFVSINKLLSAKIFSNNYLQPHLDQLAAQHNYAEMEKILSGILSKEEKKQDWLSKEVQNTGCYEALKRDRDLTRKWGLYIYILSFYFSDTLQKFNRIVEFKNHDRDEILQAIQQLSQLKPPPPNELIESFKKYISDPTNVDGQEHYNIHGAPLSGAYTSSEYKLFKELQQAKAAGQSITASTNGNFSNVPGLRPKHAYTVVDVLTRDEHGKQIMYVRLRNPWGKVGRIYEQDGTPKESNEAAEFDLDIRDFVTYYDSYTVGSIPTDDELRATLAAQNSQIAQRHRDTFHRPLEQITDREKYYVISELLLQKQKQNEFFKEQNIHGLFELYRYLTDEIFHLEKNLLSKPNQEETLLPAIKVRKELKKELKIFMKANDYAIFLDKKAKNKFFQKEFVKRLETNPDWRQGFRRLAIKKDGAIDEVATKANRDHFIFNLISRHNCRDYLSMQSISDLSEIIKYLKVTIPQKQKENNQLRNNVKNKKVRKISKRHLSGYLRLQEKVESVFKERLKTSTTYAAIKENAQKYVDEKKKKSRLYSFKRSFKLLFNFDSKETKLVKMYKRHSKYIEAKKADDLAAKPVLSEDERIMLAKEYLIGKAYGALGRTCFSRVSDLTALEFEGKRKVMAGEINSIEIKKNGDDGHFQLKILTRNKTKVEGGIITALSKTALSEYAEAQLQYRQQVMEKIKDEDASAIMNEFLKYQEDQNGEIEKLDLRALPKALSKMIQDYGHKNIQNFAVVVDETGQGTVTIQLADGIQAKENCPTKCDLPIRDLENCVIAAYEYAQYEKQNKTLATNTGSYDKKVLNTIRQEKLCIKELALAYFRRANVTNISDELQRFLKNNKRMQYTWQLIETSEGYTLSSTVRDFLGADVGKNYITNTITLTEPQVQEFAIAQFLLRQANVNNTDTFSHGGTLGEIKRLKLNIDSLAAEQLQENKQSQLRYVRNSNEISYIQTANESQTFNVGYTNGSSTVLKLDKQIVEDLALLRFEKKMREQEYFRENASQFRIR